MLSITSSRLVRHCPELDGKTFLLGVGGMKCATSWVFQHLQTLPGMTASPIKELHFFNAKLRPPGHQPFTPLLTGLVRDYLEQSGDIGEEIAINPHFQAAVDCLRMLHDDNAYFDLFARMVTPETRVLGEITPQYAILGQQGFAWVQAFFATQKMDLKILFIMRDPVQRLWSHLRSLQAQDPDLDIVSDLPTLLRRRGVIERSDYWQTVEALDATFPPGDVLYLFYEDLFAGDALKRLSAFVGLPDKPLQTERQNETAVKTVLPDAVRAKLARVLAPQYRFCRDRFGTGIPAAWQA